MPTASCVYGWAARAVRRVRPRDGRPRRGRAHATRGASLTPRNAVKAILGDALSGLRARRGRTALAAGGVFAASLVLGCGHGRLCPGHRLRPCRGSRRPTVRDRALRWRRSRHGRRTGARSAQPGGCAPTAPRSPVCGSARRPAHPRGRRPHRRRRSSRVRDRRGPGRPGARRRGRYRGRPAREWGLGPGDRIDVGRLGPVRVAGVALSPDNVAFPLVRTARVYLSRSGLVRRFGGATRR